MEVKITVTGTKKALNDWTMATATVDGKEFKIQMVRFDEPSKFGIRKGRISKLWVGSADGVEVINSCRSDFENRMAALYAESYGLLATAGSDNHRAGAITRLSGVETEEPICSPEDYIRLLREGKTHIFDYTREPDPTPIA